MNKRGLIGKVLLVIGIFLLIVGIIIGFTAYQGYDLYKTITTEQPNIESDVEALERGDCSRIPKIEASIEEIKTKAERACKNPLINYAVEKIQQIPVKCSELPTIESRIQTNLSIVKEICANLSITNQSFVNSSLPIF